MGLSILIIIFFSAKKFLDETYLYGFLFLLKLVFASLNTPNLNLRLLSGSSLLL